MLCPSDGSDSVVKYSRHSFEPFKLDNKAR